VLVCVKLDRLGRSTRDVLNLVHELDQKGAFLRILEPAISTDGPMGKMVLTVLGMVAEMELSFIKARQRDGIERAKSIGDVYKGRKPTIDPSTVRDLFNEGIGASEIARRLSALEVDTRLVQGGQGLLILRLPTRSCTRLRLASTRPEHGARPIQWARAQTQRSLVHFANGDDRMPKRAPRRFRSSALRALIRSNLWSCVDDRDAVTFIAWRGPILRLFPASLSH
jgi:hypothetical protein